LKNKISLFKSVILVFAIVLLTGCTSPGSNSKPDSKPVESGKLKEVHEAVKAVYGENYIPSMPFDDMQIEEKFGIKKDMVKEIIAEGPMMSTNVDIFIGVEAVEGQGDEIEKALQTYKKKLEEDTLQYPMNIPKIKSSIVLKVDNYVFFLQLGEINTDGEDEAEQLAFAEAEVKKAVDAVHEILGK
jgi:hypothetical protein